VIVSAYRVVTVLLVAFFYSLAAFKKRPSAKSLAIVGYQQPTFAQGPTC